MSYNYTQGDVPEGEFASLSVYRFDPQATDSTPPMHAASFALPALPLPESFRRSISVASLACDPATKASKTGTSSESFSKTFVPAPQKRLLRLDILFMRHQMNFDRSYRRSLLIPSVVLLDALPTYQEHYTDPIVVPWVNWGAQTSWANTKDLNHTRKLPWFGQRMAGVHPGTLLVKPELVIFDFDQHRVKARAMSDAQSIWQVCTPGNSPAGDICTIDEDFVFKGPEDLARKKYMKAVFPVGMEVGRYDVVMTDDEYGECMRIPSAFFNDLLIVTMFPVIIRTVCQMLRFCGVLHLTLILMSPQQRTPQQPLLLVYTF